MRDTSRGFSLLELMIVVAIIGIIAAVAFPSYGSYVRRTNRTAAKTVVSDVVSRQENYFTERKQYAPTLVALGYPADPFFVDKEGRAYNAANPPGVVTIYSIALVNPLANSYTVTAATVAGTPQAKDAGCATLSIDSTGRKTSTGGATDCWSK